jgi:acyl carrier protein
MTSDEFVKYFAEQFERVDKNEIRVDSKFRSLEEWSSMQALFIIAMVDEKFGLVLTGDDIKECQTVGDLYQVLSRKKK